MYWVYLALFVLVILTPKIIVHGYGFLHEEDLESLLILFFGAFGFFLYLAKDKALLQAFREKLHLQKQTSIITRDLSDSYSYIGEMNRKFDIVKEMIYGLPKDAVAQIESRTDEDLYRSIFDAVTLLAKVEEVSLRFVDMETRTLEAVAEEKKESVFDIFDAETLLSSEKTFWNEKGYVVVRSPRQARSVTAFLIFPKVMNRVEDAEIYKILASEALFLYAVRAGQSRAGKFERASDRSSEPQS